MYTNNVYTTNCTNVHSERLVVDVEYSSAVANVPYAYFYVTSTLNPKRTSVIFVPLRYR